MKLSDFYYDLPPDRIAQEPASPRDRARLMVVRAGTDAVEHRRFHELDQLLRGGDVLVVNATRVFPARLRGKKSTGGKIEALLLGPTENPSRWRALIRGTAKATSLVFAEGLAATMQETAAQGEWLLEFSSTEIRPYLDRHGEMPLPPYIKRPSPRAGDRDRYQTVYAANEGAVAAPTAGFHFTPELLDRLRKKGVDIVEITLHVGWGTFRPIRSERVEDHPMLPESYEVTDAAADKLNEARAAGRRIIAVGTTSVRTLETVCDAAGAFRSGTGQAGLYIFPGYRFRAINALITNFHLPDSTPLLLACAFRHFFAPVANEPFSLRFAYRSAVQEGYRFYSYGDAMLIE